MNKSLFSQGPDPLFRLFLFSILSIALIILELKFGTLDSTRTTVGNFALPVYHLAEAPHQAFEGIKNSVLSQRSLRKENRQLEQEKRILATQVLQLQALKRENQQLRDLLNSSQRLSNKFTASRLLAVNMSPGKHQIIIDKGSAHLVEQDMPILDEYGVMGRLKRVYNYHSEATLISDPNHALPVLILRNGTRSIATGLGRTDRLKLQYLPVNSDVKVGDKLVTSGLGGKFPADYPVGEIRKITRSPNSPFAEILVEPYAQLDVSKEVLIITSKLDTAENSSSTDKINPGITGND